MRSKELAIEVARELAKRDKRSKFIISSLRLMENDEMTAELLEYLRNNPDATKRILRKRCFSCQ